MGLESLTFANPLMLWALALLPALWWILRLTPPLPKMISFPPIDILRTLVQDKTTAAHTPWWLLLLRVLICALIILALSMPVLNPPPAMNAGGKDFLLVIDNGFASAQSWQARMQTGLRLIDQAEKSGRKVVILPTAQGEDGGPVRPTNLMSANDARGYLKALKPQPWPVSRSVPEDGGDFSVFWLSDGLDDGSSGDFFKALAKKGDVTLIDDARVNSYTLLLEPVLEGAKITVALKQFSRELPGRTVTLDLLGNDGRVLDTAEVSFAAAEIRAEHDFELLPEIRNQIARIEVRDNTTAGTVVLLDEDWRRRPVGILASDETLQGQSLLSDIFYLTRALDPYTTLYLGDWEKLKAEKLSLIVLPDSYTLAVDEEAELESFVRNGGSLIRFAGARLGQEENAVLVTAPLRRGERSLEGAMTWEEPAKLSEFPEVSPFFGNPVPGDVAVRRQVLSEPGAELAAMTWVGLKDGTPLVTSKRMGGGRLTLVHTTAGPEWSNLCLSGLYVDILRRAVEMSAGVSSGKSAATLTPVKMLSAFGRLSDPSAFVLPLDSAARAGFIPSPKNPPGYYGSAGVQEAMNLTKNITHLDLLENVPAGITVAAYEKDSQIKLKGNFLLAAVICALVDYLISLYMRGRLFIPALAKGAIFVFLALYAPQVYAETLQDLTRASYLAYVRTGDMRQDEVSELGLKALADQAVRRTSVEISGVAGIHILSDDLSLYPLIYWPLTSAQAPLVPDEMRRLQYYLDHGGMILFDTRDGQFGVESALGTQNLRRVLGAFKFPPLEKIPADHVLGRSFYLLDSFPGLYETSAFWIEKKSASTFDGVPSVLVGAADWAGAWALGGGRQREMSYRFGVNLIMMAMTGNYKSDQIHVPFILERLGK